ncbi:glycosyltransferase [Cylindrospermum sp. FACHB-282]|uniref:glycosyltransferase n=1 Tax=Cylindrospermum sp. FACHB-282 TaxID=2692794 RepID=UPI001681F968|nr:glycosyltransferase [Cylindrospermum sp. FACHB-282]MBD2387484.1 glycosyltransferase [Cylindrospermum sp. FACHB-282]
MNLILEKRQIQSTVILHIAPITHNQISGLTFAIPPSVNSLQRLGVQTGLLTTSTSGCYEKPELYPVNSILNLPRYPAIASMPQPLNQPDIIVFHSTYILEHILLAYEAVQRKIPYIITPHGGMTEGAQQQKHLKKKVGNFLFFNWMVENAAALHCLTEEEAFDVKKIWNRPVFVVGNGVDLPPRQVLAKPGSKAELKFVFLGRLDIHHKGLDLLVEACSMIQQKLRLSKVQVLLYGSDIKGSKVKLQEMINNYQIQDLIHLKDPVWQEKKQEVFQSTDLFIHTSRFEGHPMAVLEALSYGIPCLLTPGTNMAKEVQAAGAGWKVEPNPAAIAEGISSVLAARSELPLRGQAARNLVEKKYSWSHIGMRSLREYERIISENI